MIPLTVHLDAEGMASDIGDDFVKGQWTDVGALPGGTESGRPSVAIMVKLPDGQTVIAETTMRLFQAAAKAFAIRYPDDGSD